MKRYNLKTLKKWYKTLLEQDTVSNEDFYLLSENFWNLKKVRKAFERFIGKDGTRPINPNIHDTCCYKYMKPSEQANVEFSFMHEVLTGKRSI